MSNSMHIHVIDGKQVSYPNNNCPICGTTPTAEKFTPNVHRKGNTVVLQVTRFQLMTLTWYQQGNAFLMSLRKVARTNDNKILRGQDGKPLWNQITLRVNIPLLKQLITEIQKIVSEVETTPTFKKGEIPQRM